MRSFLQRLRNTIPRCVCPHGHNCGRRNVFGLTTSLNEVLALKLALSTEANTSSLGHSPSFSCWGSVEPEDRYFGSTGSFWEADLTGKNSLLVLDLGTPFKEIEKRLESLIESKRPTRIVLVCPSPKMAVGPNRGYILLASVPQGFPLILSEYGPTIQIIAESPFSIILVTNKESPLY